MPDMFDNLKRTGSMTNAKGAPKERDDNWVERTFRTNCTQCKSEKATGSFRDENNKFHRVGNKCRKAMGIKGKKGQQDGNRNDKPVKPNQPKPTNKPVIKVKSERADGKNQIGGN